MLRNLALALVATALSLLALEAGVRLAHLQVNETLNENRKFGLHVEWDPDGQYFRGVRGASIEINKIPIHFNSLGVRGDEPPPKAPGRFRVVCLGDSVTAGAGVRFEDAYPQRLGAHLRDRGVDVMSAAIGGWNTVEEERFLRRWVDTLAPDLVVLLYVANDAEQVNPWMIEHRSARGAGDALYRALVMHSKLFEWAAWVWVTRFAPDDREATAQAVAWQQEYRAVKPFTPEHAGWQASRAALARLHALAQERGFRLMVVVWSLSDKPPDGSPFLPLVRVREFGAAEGVTVVDSDDFFKTSGFWGDLVLAPFVDHHPNPKGHEILASGLADLLVRDGWLAPSH